MQSLYSNKYALWIYQFPLICSTVIASSVIHNAHICITYLCLRVCMCVSVLQNQLMINEYSNIIHKINVNI